MSGGPRRNRVDPFGRLIAVPARGTLMGNRGCLHDARGRIRRFHRGTRWIFCRLEFKGRTRELMQPGRYTELFFLDEATAFAAGHRPCWKCMRERANEFRGRWAAANRGAVEAEPTAAGLDEALHRERIGPGGRKTTFEARLAELPDGAVVVPPSAGERGPLPHLLWADRLWPWSPDGYGTGSGVPAAAVEVLTPASTVRTFGSGFRPKVALAERLRRARPSA